MRCWKSQERMMLVACLGSTPRLFLDFLSSLSKRDERSRFIFTDESQGTGGGGEEQTGKKIHFRCVVVGEGGWGGCTMNKEDGIIEL